MACNLIFAEGGKRDGPALYMRIGAKGVRTRRGPVRLQSAAARRVPKGPSSTPSAALCCVPHSRRPPRRAISKSAAATTSGSPRGFDADHPSAEWLLHKGLWAGINEPIPDVLFTAKAVNSVAARLKLLAPVQRWIAKELNGKELNRKDLN